MFSNTAWDDAVSALLLVPRVYFSNVPQLQYKNISWPQQLGEGYEKKNQCALTALLLRSDYWGFFL